MAEKRDLRLELADRLIEQIEQGTASWQRPWEAGDVLAPINAVTGKPYRGVNREFLTTFSPDLSDPRWMTLKQANSSGWSVKPGSAGVPIEKWTEYEHRLTEEEQRKLRDEGLEPKDSEKRLGVRYYTVFHASQVDGIPPIERPARDWEIEGTPDDRLPRLAEAMGVRLEVAGGQAFYRPSEDLVRMPPAETFRTASGHDTTLLHELSHATGHESRLNRDLTGTFGSQKYAVEELRAEMSAAMTAASLGIGFDPDAQSLELGREQGNTAAYLAAWLRTLPEKERKQTILGAVRDAQGISDYLLERTPEVERNLELSQSPRTEELPDFAPIGRDGFVLSRNPEKAGLEVKFQEKPGQEILAGLKEGGFRWSRKEGLWYARDTDKARETLASTLGVDLDAAVRREQEKVMDMEAQQEQQDLQETHEERERVYDFPNGYRDQAENMYRWLRHEGFSPELDIGQRGGEYRTGIMIPANEVPQLRNLQKTYPARWGNHPDVEKAIDDNRREMADTALGVSLELAGPSVQRGDYIRYKDPVNGQDREGVVLDDAEPGEKARIRHIYRWENGTPAFHAGDEIFPQSIPPLEQYLPGAVFPAKMDGIDPQSLRYGRTMGMDNSRRIDENLALMDVERARGVYPALIWLREIPEAVRPFLGDNQLIVTNELLKGEESAFFSDKMQELEILIQQMPESYETDGKPDQEKPVSLRYFGPGNSQWFIIEKDRGDPANHDMGQKQAFGLADLGQGFPEMGYINIEEITKHGVEMDYHFEPTNLLEIKKAHYPEMVRTISMGESLKEPLDTELVDHLQARAAIRHGELSVSAALGGMPQEAEWPGELPTGLGGDSVANAEVFTNMVAMRDPEKAVRWAEELLKYSDRYAAAVPDVSPEKLIPLAKDMARAAGRSQSPVVGDLVRAEPRVPSRLLEPFNGRVIAKMDTTGGDHRYHLRAEVGPNGGPEGMESTVYGKDYQFRTIHLDQAYGFERDAPERVAQQATQERASVDPKEQAVIDYNRFHQTLPDRVDSLIEHTHERFTVIDPTSSAAYAQAMYDTMAESDKVFGIITQGEDRGAFAPQVALSRAGVESERQQELRDIWAGTSRAQSDRYRDAVEEAKNAHKVRMRERGKDMLRQADSLSPEQTVMACFFKQGIMVDEKSGSVQKMLQAVENKDLKTLTPWIGDNSQNPASEEAFSRLTGVTLGKTQKERVRQLEKWAGPEKVQALQQERAEKARAKAVEAPRQALLAAFESLKTAEVQVSMDGGTKVLDGQEYLEYKVSQGYTQVAARKKGAITERVLRNPETNGISSFNHQRFRNFCKAVSALEPGGDIATAMDKAGIPPLLAQGAEKTAPTPEQKAPEVETRKTTVATPRLVAGLVFEGKESYHATIGDGGAGKLVVSREGRAENLPLDFRQDLPGMASAAMKAETTLRDGTRLDVVMRPGAGNRQINVLFAEQRPGQEDRMPLGSAVLLPNKAAKEHGLPEKDVAYLKKTLGVDLSAPQKTLPPAKARKSPEIA